MNDQYKYKKHLVIVLLGILHLLKMFEHSFSIFETFKYYKSLELVEKPQQPDTLHFHTNYNYFFTFSYYFSPNFLSLKLRFVYFFVSQKVTSP